MKGKKQEGNMRLRDILPRQLTTAGKASSFSFRGSMKGIDIILQMVSSQD